MSYTLRLDSFILQPGRVRARDDRAAPFQRVKEAAEMGEPVLVSVGDAAAWAGVTTRTIKRWAATGRVDKHQTPHGVRYDLRQVPARQAS